MKHQGTPSDEDLGKKPPPCSAARVSEKASTMRFKSPSLCAVEMKLGRLSHMWMPRIRM